LPPSVPQAYTLFTLSLPPSTLTHPPSSKALDEALFSTFNKQREIEWTFREDEPAVNPILSTVGLGAVLAPWVVLLALVRIFLLISRPSPLVGFL
jgi:hypothetical protein